MVDIGDGMILIQQNGRTMQALKDGQVFVLFIGHKTVGRLQGFQLGGIGGRWPIRYTGPIQSGQSSVPQNNGSFCGKGPQNRIFRSSPDNTGDNISSG